MILVFGKSGQVAVELSKLNGVLCLGRDTWNLEDPHTFTNIIHRHNPKSVINAAAYTSVDGAEDEENAAYKINAVAPSAIARACKDFNIPFLHISTDYVFDGSGTTPWNHDDMAFPLGAYGRTKREGELAVIAENPNAIIFRTSWVFSVTGSNFVKSMLNLAKNNSEISIVADQIGGPTSARSIAEACYKIVGRIKNGNARISKNGLYHFSGVPDVSWAEFAEEIFKKTQSKVSIKKISTAEYPTRARRPLNSRLNCTKLEKDFEIARSNWKVELDLVLTELKELKS